MHTVELLNGEVIELLKLEIKEELVVAVEKGSYEGIVIPLTAITVIRDGLNHKDEI